MCSPPTADFQPLKSQRIRQEAFRHGFKNVECKQIVRDLKTKNRRKGEGGEVVEGNQR